MHSGSRADMSADDAYDDVNGCSTHAGLLGGRCLGRRCRVLLEYPGALCGGFVCQRCKQNYYHCIILYILCIIDNMKISFLHSFIHRKRRCINSMFN